jgi:SNF2 family DNA or RNA helicase
MHGFYLTLDCTRFLLINNRVFVRFNVYVRQRDGVRFVFKNKGRAIIADEMGLGKTIQAIASACMYRESWPILVVAPSSARHHWKVKNNPEMPYCA